MSDVPGDLRYTKDHEWVRLLEDGTAQVGITEHAQDALGDLVFVEVPELGAELTAGDACAVVESVKAASDVYCPLDAEIVEVNEVLAETPEVINSDPYGEGWLMRIQPVDAGAIEELMSADDYQQFLDEQD